MNYTAIAADSPCRVGLHNYQEGRCFDCGDPQPVVTKSLGLVVRVEGLPEHARDYRIGGAACVELSKRLKAEYGNQVNVIVTFPKEAP